MFQIYGSSNSNKIYKKIYSLFVTPVALHKFMADVKVTRLLFYFLVVFNLVSENRIQML